MSNEKWTAANIPDQTGRVAVVTGANSGLGLEATRELARKGASVVLAVRSMKRVQAAIDDIRTNQPDADLQLQELDLSSLDSIHTAADKLRSRLDRIDLLINNAGVMYTPQIGTADGFEMQFGTNHLGHFAWTGLLLNRLRHTSCNRMTGTSFSRAHQI